MLRSNQKNGGEAGIRGRPLCGSCADKRLTTYAQAGSAVTTGSNVILRHRGSLDITEKRANLCTSLAQPIRGSDAVGMLTQSSPPTRGVLALDLSYPVPEPAPHHSEDEENPECEEAGLTRISHKLPATTTHLRTLTASCSLAEPQRTVKYASGRLDRVPCHPTDLRRLAATPYEKPGLKRPWVGRVDAASGLWLFDLREPSPDALCRLFERDALAPEHRIDRLARLLQVAAPFGVLE